MVRISGGRGTYRVSVGQPEGKRPLGRQRRRFEDNIKNVSSVSGWGVMDWIVLVKERRR